MIGIGAAMSDPALFGQHFAGPSWDCWKAVLKAAFAESLSDTELALFRAVASRNPPQKRVSELDVVAGRGAGKDSIASLIATLVAVSFDPKGLRPGELGHVMCLACDRDQWNHMRRIGLHSLCRYHQ